MHRTKSALVEETSLFTYMTEHHAQLEAVFVELLEAMRVNAPDVPALWTKLDHGLLSHMEAEERYVLPAFARVDRAAALEVLREHGQIRAMLLELGVAVDLHSIRFEQSEELIRLLRAHASTEDNLLYRWADQRLDDALRAATRRHAERAA